MGASTRTCHGRYSPSFPLWFFLIHRIGPARKLQGQIAVTLQALSEVFAQRLRLLSFNLSWKNGQIQALRDLLGIRKLSYVKRFEHNG